MEGYTHDRLYNTIRRKLEWVSIDAVTPSLATNPRAGLLPSWLPVALGTTYTTIIIIITTRVLQGMPGTNQVAQAP